jgi:hypothetical protein
MQMAKVYNLMFGGKVLTDGVAGKLLHTHTDGALAKSY